MLGCNVAVSQAKDTAPFVVWKPNQPLPTLPLLSLLLSVQEVEAAEQKAASEAAARAAAEAAALAPSKQLAAALALRGYKLTLPEVKVGARKPYVDAADGSVHWPVLLMYPETGQQDVIQDWHEDDPVDAHLDVVSQGE